jgi:prepilin-type N-terminal cleavage/methylation domain-containing protein/prepilin-type processing-associated H-X9-DG protein
MMSNFERMEEVDCARGRLHFFSAGELSMARVRRGFTLVELLVVMTIIAILMGLLTAGVARVREAGRRTQCMNDMRQFGSAVMQYENARQKMPGYLNKMGGTDTNGAQQLTIVGWVPPLLGYLGRGDIFKLFNENTTLNTIPPTVVNAGLEMATCASDRNHPLGPDNRSPVGLSFVPNGGIDDSGTEQVYNGVFFDHTVTPALSISLSSIARKDGATNTLMLSENVQAEKWNSIGVSPKQDSDAAKRQKEFCLLWNTTNFWGVGINKDVQGQNMSGNELQYARPSSYHPGGVNAIFCDGSHRFVAETIEPIVYALIMTPDGAKAGQTRILSATDFER